MDFLRLSGPLILSFAAALAIDWRMERGGLLPPLFQSSVGPFSPVAAARRAGGGVLLVGILYLAVLSPLTLLGTTVPEPDLSEVGAPQLFVVHGLLATTLALWYALGFVPRPAGVAGWRDQFGLRAASIRNEVLVGAAAGAAIWLSVIALLLFLGALIFLLGGGEALPQGPPSMVLWMAGLPVALRVLVALSAGVFEEIFFRGFLQPRVGIGLSTVLFTVAHLSYQQPFMLVGVAVLSVCFAVLVRWRQSVWAAVTAHAVFDLVQLLVILPLGARALA